MTEIVTVRQGRRSFQALVGGLRVTEEAAQDVLPGAHPGVLLPNPEDQQHLALVRDPGATTRRVAIDTAYTTQVDPFRWRLLRDIIQSDERIVVTKFLTPDWFAQRFRATRRVAGVDQTDELTMQMLGAAGITLPRAAVVNATPSRACQHFSADPTTSVIYYGDPVSAMMDQAAMNSLPHELFGHMWLALQHVPWGHPPAPGSEAERLALARGCAPSSEALQAQGSLSGFSIVDPLGNPFVGSVEVFIRRFTDAQLGPGGFTPTNQPFHSRTHYVSVDHLRTFSREIHVRYPQEMTLPLPTRQGSAIGPFRPSPQLLFALHVVAGNYEVAPSVATLSNATVSRESVARAEVDWFRTLDATQQYWFMWLLHTLQVHPDMHRPFFAELIRMLGQVYVLPQGVPPYGAP